MIFNAARVSVCQWDGIAESRCPECGEDLIAKRGDVIVWHWAHRPHADGRTTCPHEESAWHLLMKRTYQTFPGWEAEVPIEVNGQTYRADAMNPRTGAIREFVHSLSEHYRAKHLALKAGGFDVLWIMDGERFASRRRRHVGDRGISRLLKPVAYQMARQLGAVVHHQGQLYAEWRGNVWFTRRGQAAAAVCQRYEQARNSGTAAPAPIVGGRATETVPHNAYHQTQDTGGKTHAA
jgi:hypothetical protein